MLDKLDYSLVPNDFALCFNGKCLHASTCLRHQVSRHIPKERWAVRAINPERVVPDGDCSGFMDDSPLKNAYGMEHLLDNIPVIRTRFAPSIQYRRGTPLRPV